MALRVLKSAAGYYIGRFCDCGPYSRDSGYFNTSEDAEAMLADMAPIDGEPDSDGPIGPDDYSDDGDALASAGMGTDEDYGYYGGEDY
jgi:hypothetical protein